MTKQRKLLPFVKKTSWTPSVNAILFLFSSLNFLTGWIIRTINIFVQFTLVLGFPFSLMLSADIYPPTQSLFVNLGWYHLIFFLFVRNLFDIDPHSLVSDV